MKKSNRNLSKRYKYLNRISFCELGEKYLQRFSLLQKMPFDIHDFYPTVNSYIYRALINDSTSPFESIDWIKFNPNPSRLSRANIKGRGTAYYSNAPNISIIEVCRGRLKSSKERTFDLTVSCWKIKKKLSLQIICSSLKAQAAGTDLYEYCLATCKKRRSELDRKNYRTWFLTTKFIADQYAKNEISCDMDFYLSAIHANTALKSGKIDGIIYPSIQYRYQGFNLAFPPRLFDEEYFELTEVVHYNSVFDRNDIYKYPIITKVKSTNLFNGDNILWK